MARSRRSYSDEFKLQAVKLVTEQGYSYAEAARQLGVRDNQIRRWKKQLDAELSGPTTGGGQPSSAQTEMLRLQVENKRLRVELEILKKAAAYFARECT